MTHVPTPGHYDGSTGIIELVYSDEWGAICDEGFGEEEAQVACRHFGFRFVDWQTASRRLAIYFFNFLFIWFFLFNFAPNTCNSVFK